jgi:hypothetical protein
VFHNEGVIKMTYTPHTWGPTDLLSGKAFNHIETQHDENKIDADAHNHDSRYYTKTIADATFFSTTFYTGFDADKIDGSHYSDLIGSAMPIGAIVYWPSEDAAPTGWHVCDGAGGTPNLRDKFIVGAGTTYNPTNTGGAFATAITGSVTIGDHTLIADEMPIHTHGYSDHYNSQELSGVGYAATGPCGTEVHDDRTTASAGGATGHGHTGSTITLNNITATPPYYALYLIMKVS